MSVQQHSQTKKAIENRERRAAAKKHGICIQCSKPVVPPYTMCETDLARNRQNSTRQRNTNPICIESARKAQKALRLKRRERGVCVQCQEPSNGFWHCQKCRDATNESKRKLTYGLTSQDIADLLKEQQSLCALCQLPFGTTRATKPVIDHCHRSGKVRALLHNTCNIGLGMFHEDIAKLEKAIGYLKAH